LDIKVWRISKLDDMALFAFRRVLGFIGMYDSDIAMHDDIVAVTVILGITDDGPFHL
jgi:hypothetical protein